MGMPAWSPHPLHSASARLLSRGAHVDRRGGQRASLSPTARCAPHHPTTTTTLTHFHLYLSTLFICVFLWRRLAGVVSSVEGPVGSFRLFFVFAWGRRRAAKMYNHEQTHHILAARCCCCCLGGCLGLPRATLTTAHPEVRGNPWPTTRASRLKPCPPECEKDGWLPCP